MQIIEEEPLKKTFIRETNIVKRFEFAKAYVSKS